MLKRVSIQNFKSLKEVTLDLQKVNLLIGPNNSGKTNFLKALEYVNVFIQNGEGEIAYDFFFRRDPTLNLFIHSIFDSPITDGLKVEGENYEHFVVESTGTYDFRNQRSGHIEWGSSEEIDSSVSINESAENVADFYAYTTGFIIVYSIDPVKIKFAYPLLPNNSILYGDASNIVPFLDTLRDKYPDKFYDIQRDLSVCIEEFTQIRFDTIEPDETLKATFGDKTFKRLGLYSAIQKQTYWADELSEGTLYFLALLCIINQPNPPKLLLLEEPEKGIHPRRIREVMNFIRRLVSEKDIQVIMTTHSPMLLDEFAESPESVFVFDKDDEGATIVKNLQRDIIEPKNEENEKLGIPPIPYTEALGEYWTIGFLGGVPHETA